MPTSGGASKAQRRVAKKSRELKESTDSMKYHMKMYKKAVKARDKLKKKGGAKYNEAKKRVKKWRGQLKRDKKKVSKSSSSFSIIVHELRFLLIAHWRLPGASCPLSPQACCVVGS